MSLFCYTCLYFGEAVKRAQQKVCTTFHILKVQGIYQKEGRKAATGGVATRGAARGHQVRCFIAFVRSVSI